MRNPAQVSVGNTPPPQVRLTLCPFCRCHAAVWVTMSDFSITAPQVEPQDWTVRDLQHLHERLNNTNQRIEVEVGRLAAWVDDLPVRHQPDPQPVRLADLALTELQRPLSLARRVVELSRLSERVDDLAQTLMDAAAIEAELFMPRPSEPPGESADLPVPDLEIDDVGEQIMLTAQCGAAWGDDEVFESQRRMVRKVMTFDGVRTSHAEMPATLNDRLSDWQTLLSAATAGALVQIQADAHARP